MKGSFVFAGRTYHWQFLPTQKKGERDALVYGLDLTRGNRPVLLKTNGEWLSPPGDRPTPLGRAAVRTAGL